MKRTATKAAKTELSKVCRELKTMREEAGLSVRELALAIDMPSSTYATYEDRFKKPYLPAWLVKKILPVLRRRGIDESRVRALAESLDDGAQLSLALPSGFPSMDAPEAVREIDVSVSAGPGALPLVEDQDIVRHVWGIPGGYIRGELLSTPADVVIVTVIGDSMEPTLRPAERVFVNTADRKPSPPGIFVIWDGINNIIKRVEFVHGSDPMKIRIISDNPLHKPYEIYLDEHTIVGRAIGSVRRL